MIVTARYRAAAIAVYPPLWTSWRLHFARVVARVLRINGAIR